MTGLRLDKFLWFARLVKSRTLAQGVIDAGHVRIEGERVIDRSRTVKPGQTLTLTTHNRFHVIRIDRLPTRRGPAQEAQCCITEIVAPSPIDARAAGN